MFSDLKRGSHIRDVRIKVWQETEGILKRLPHPPKSVKHSLRPDERPQKKYDTTDVRVSKDDTIVAARRLQGEGLKPMVLNLADDCFPGGFVVAGSGAQEESLFRRSNYCISLHNDPLKERLYPIHSNEAIYSPDVTVFRTTEADGYRFLQRPFKLDFIACPGLKYPQLVQDSEDERKHLSDTDKQTLRQKIRLILQVGAETGHDSLVLGALGCGAWNNPPRDVAAIFKDVLAENQGVFKVIVFAILSVTEFDTDNYQIFKDVLKGT